MNWDVISAFSETIGAIAVIVTIGYLAVQIRQQNAAMRSAATQEASGQAADLYLSMAMDQRLPIIFVEFLNDPTSKNSEETARFMALMTGAFFNIQNWYFQSRDGYLDESLWNSWSRVIRMMSALPGFQLFWEQRSSIYSSEFCKHLETEVFDAEPAENFRPLGVASD